MSSKECSLSQVVNSQYFSKALILRCLGTVDVWTLSCKTYFCTPIFRRVFKFHFKFRPSLLKTSWVALFWFFDTLIILFERLLITSPEFIHKGGWRVQLPIKYKPCFILSFNRIQFVHIWVTGVKVKSIWLRIHLFYLDFELLLGHCLSWYFQTFVQIYFLFDRIIQIDTLLLDLIEHRFLELAIFRYFAFNNWSH